MTPSRNRLRPAWPARRRLRSLTHFSFSADDLASELGCHRTTVQNLLVGRQVKVRAGLDERIRDLYARWEGRPVSGQLPAYRRRRWPAPLDWDDIDDPDEDRTPDVRLSAAGSRYWLRRCVQHGAPLAEVADHLRGQVSLDRLRRILSGDVSSIRQSDDEAIQSVCARVRSREAVRRYRQLAEGGH